jgi:REP-associated tyrosine transposase
MARPLRIEFSGAIYHVISRGNAREDICLDDTDRAMFLGVLAEVISNVGWVKRSEPTINVGRDADSIFPKDLINRDKRRLSGWGAAAPF